jgi:hypothetical protein
MRRTRCDKAYSGLFPLNLALGCLYLSRITDLGFHVSVACRHLPLVARNRLPLCAVAFLLHCGHDATLSLAQLPECNRILLIVTGAATLTVVFNNMVEAILFC